MGDKNIIINNTIPQCAVIVDSDEYKKLCDDNKELNKQIALLNSNDRLLNESVRVNNITIDELREKNKLLAEEIDKLLIHLQKSELELKEIKNDFNTFKNNSLFKKYLVAIQDYNSIMNIDIKNKITFQRLRKNRIDECHFLNDDDDIVDTNNKLAILLNKLKNIPSEITIKFNKLYPNLLNALKPFVVFDSNDVEETMYNAHSIWWD